MMKVFYIPERTPGYGYEIEDFCKFWSYLFVNGNKKSFKIEMKESCVNCGDTKKLVIHHIIPFSEFGLHDEKNLIVLCRRCHNKVHYNNLKLKEKGVIDLEWVKQYNQLIDLSKNFSSRQSFQTEVIDKINLIFECLKLPAKKTSHIPFEKFVIKIKTTQR